MRALLVLIAGFVAHLGAGAACPPAGVSHAQMVELRASEGAVADHAKRQALALALQDCLGDPDPFLRDEVAFGSLEQWIRTQQLDRTTLARLRTTQLARLKQADAAGLAQPFAALVLGEVAYADRIQPQLSAAERSELVQAGAAYLGSVRDYRGYDAQQGWRHAVAHAADMMMELALNPALSQADQRLILSAVAAQLSGARSHTPAQFFHYGEGERLAVPVFNLASRADLDTAEWDAWFSALAVKPAGSPDLETMRLAGRHNLRSFLGPLYILLNESKDAAQRARLLPFVRRELKLQ